MSRFSRSVGVRPAVTVLAALACALSVLTGPLAGPADAAAPARVTGVQVGSATISGTKAGLTVRWQRAARARSYRVSWSRSRSMSNPRHDSTRKRAYTLSRLRPGTRYCFQVRGVAGGVKGRRSAVVCKVTRPPQARPVWVSRQAIEDRRTTLTVHWPRVRGARSYELEWAAGMDVQVPGKSTRTGIKAPASGPVTTVVRGLAPGRVHCFQVRARNGSGVGYRAGKHCKFTMPLDRAPSTSTLVIDVGTFNVCSSCTGFKTRQHKVRDRIYAMDVGVAAVQEAGEATDYLTQNLAGHTRACKTGDGAAWRDDVAERLDGQAVFVRDADFAVVPGSANGFQFESGKSHGACWAEVVHRATQRHVVVLSTHLHNKKGATEDRIREKQTDLLLARIAEQYDGGAMPPLVLAGDFNSHRNRGHDGPRVRLEQDGYLDGYDAAAAYLTPPYQNSGSAWSTVPVCSWTWGGHVDRVFAPPGAHIRSWRLVEPMTAGRYTQLLSDHSPVRVSVQLD